MKRISLALAFLTALSLPVMAQDFQKGWDAYNAGDFATAIQEWTPLAVAGDASAQYNLGVTYRSGESTGYSDILGGLTSWVN
jgi:TPR repeat protein